MRICLLTRFFSDRNQGIGVYSTNLLRGLADRGCAVSEVSTGYSGNLGYFYYTALGIRFKMPEDADVYHALSPYESIWLPRERSVTTFHDLIPWLYSADEIMYAHRRFRSPIAHFASFWFRLAAKTASESRLMICNSEQTKSEVMEHLGVPEERLRLVRMGLADGLAPSKVPHDGYRIGTLSALDPRKRIDILVGAFRKLDDPKAELLIPSRGREEERLRMLADGDPRIKFTGYLPEERKAEYLNSLDVFVLPTKFEGYGFPFVEAMACGVPTISLKDATIPEEVKSRTHAVESSDLWKVLRDRKFECDVRAGIEFARLHSWKGCASETEAVYRELAE